MKTKRLMAVILVLCMMLYALPVVVGAAGGTTYTWTTLQSALDAAANGDTITLGGNVTAQAGNTALTVAAGKSVTLDLNGYTLNRALASSDANGQVFVIPAGASLTVTDSEGTGTITGGYANRGGAFHNSGTLNISGVYITGNHSNHANSTNYGGAIYNAGTLTVTDCVIAQNDGDDGGAIFNAEGGFVTLTDTTVSNNRSVNHGGGALVNYGTAELEDCYLNGNTAEGAGGAIWSRYAVTLSGCIIRNNTSHATGGGICLNNAGMLWMDDSCVITGNTSNDGGGIYIGEGCTATISDVTITGNSAVVNGGGGITNYGTLSLSGSSEITANTSVGNGGGIWNTSDYFNMQGTVLIRNNHSGSADNNLYLAAKKTINLTGALSADSEIGLTAQYYLTDVTSGWSDYQSNPGVYADIFSDDLHAQAMDETDLPMITLNSDNGEVAFNSYFVDIDENGTKFFRLLPEGTAKFSDIFNLDGTKKPYGPNFWSWVIVDTDYYNITKRIEVSSTFPSYLYLIISDGVTLNCLGGLEVEQGGSYGLVIYGQKNDSGVLTASSPQSGTAGIGGISMNDYINRGHSRIYIYGATVNAYGGPYAAGIGSGDGKGMYATVRDIKIYGGIVNARGGQDAAGIGGGNGNLGGNVYIYGGTVTATGGQYGAGIGTGDEPEESTLNPDKCGNIFISGGTVTATGGEQAAAIGGGNEGAPHSITITGGNITANSGNIAAAIGAGDDAEGCDVTITGGHITLTTDDGIYIGSPNESNHGNLSVLNEMCVKSNSVKVAKDQRGNVLRSNDSGEVVIELCDHAGGISYQTSAASHTALCAYCYSTFEAEPHTLNDSARCTVCGYQATMATVSFTRGGGSGSMSNVSVVPGRTYTLPSCNFSAPYTQLFCGWQVGEEIMQPGETVTVNSDLTLTATWGTPEFAGITLEQQGNTYTASFAVEKKWVDIGCMGLRVEIERNGSYTTVTEYTVSGNYCVFRFTGLTREQASEEITVSLCATRAGDNATYYTVTSFLGAAQKQCDINGDNTTNILDLIRYKKQLSEAPSLEEPAQNLPDFDFDGLTNATDIVYLTKILLL